MPQEHLLLGYFKLFSFLMEYEASLHIHVAAFVLYYLLIYAAVRIADIFRTRASYLL